MKFNLDILILPCTMLKYFVVCSIFKERKSNQSSQIRHFKINNSVGKE